MPDADDKQQNKLTYTYSTSMKDFAPPPTQIRALLFEGTNKKFVIVLVTFHIRTNLKKDLSKF